MKIEASEYFFKDDAQLWNLISEHLYERKEFQRMVLSSVDAFGKPRLRTMVLRSLDLKNKTLNFYTDSRSPKLKHWQEHAFTEALAYSHTELIQLRLSGLITIINKGPLYEKAKGSLSAHQLTDYNSKIAPGSLYDADKPVRSEELHFSIIQLKVEHLEVLILQPKEEEHFRWTFCYDLDGEVINSKRLVP